MTAELRYIDAIHDGLQASLAADDAVVVIGEDVTYGGPFGATKGLADEFGRHRVRDTPISEATVMGMATGRPWGQLGAQGIASTDSRSACCSLGSRTSPALRAA